MTYLIVQNQPIYYIDVLLLQLGTSGLGCYIDNVLLGALGYADDIVIMSPSIRGLNEMIRVCESYADEYSLLFNEQKEHCCH